MTRIRWYAFIAACFIPTVVLADPPYFKYSIVLVLRVTFAADRSLTLEPWTVDLAGLVRVRVSCYLQGTGPVATIARPRVWRAS